MLPNPRGLCFDSPIGICQKPRTESLFATFRCRWICRVSSGRVASTTAWACCRAFWCSGLHSELAVLRVRVTPKWGICCLQKPKRPIKHCASVVVVRDARYSDLSFTLKGLLQYRQQYCITIIKLVKKLRS